MSAKWSRKENNMEISLTKKQYWDLIRAVYMAGWMANAICDGDMQEDEGIKNIRNFIFSFAKEAGLEQYATYDAELNDFYATWDLDEEPSVRDLIDRYDEHSFWEEITERFGERDFFEKFSEAEIIKMSDEERVTKRWESEEKWGEEFENHGIDRLVVDEAKELKY